MKTFFNFQTKQEINPLLAIEYFYTSPFMPENQVKLNLVDKLEEVHSNGGSLISTNTQHGHVVTLFPIGMLVTGNVMIKWREKDSFVINNKIYCKIVDEKTIRVDTIL